jgi:putative transposase
LTLVRQFDALSHEHLQPATRVRTHHLAKSIREAGWGAFLTILTPTAACAGRRVVGVHPADPSPQWSGCGDMGLKGLSVRWPSCPEGGTDRHRDHNAARNSKSAGRALRGGVAVAASENRASPGFSHGECQATRYCLQNISTPWRDI